MRPVDRILPGDPPHEEEVDPANDTLYTANFDNTVSAFDLQDLQRRRSVGLRH